MTTQTPSPIPPAPAPEPEPGIFSWHQIPRRIRLAMKHMLGLKGDAEVVLSEAFGTPPSPEVVDACWTVLRDDWLASPTGAHPRKRIVEALRNAGLGDHHLKTTTRTSHLAYLQSVSPSPTRTDIVHHEFVLLGRDTREAGEQDVLTHCGLYRPGHTPHPIQALHAFRDTDHPPIECTLVEARSDGVVVLDADGTTHRVWNHEPARLARLAAQGGAVKLRPRWHLLSIEQPGSSSVFSVDFNRLDRGNPCETQPDPDSDETRVDHLLDPAHPNPDRCPACHAPAVPIAYGFPSDAILETVERGGILIGGCLVDRHNPTHGCANGHRWRTRP